MDVGGIEASTSAVDAVQEFNLTAKDIDSSDSGAEDTGTSSSETPSNKDDGDHTPSLEFEDCSGKQESPVKDPIAQFQALAIEQSTLCQTVEPGKQPTRNVNNEPEDSPVPEQQPTEGDTEQLSDQSSERSVAESASALPEDQTMDHAADYLLSESETMGQSLQQVLDMLAGPAIQESANDPNSMSSDAPFPFLQLPYDIRKKVYDEVLSCSPDSIEPDVTGEYWRHGNLANAGALDLDLGGLALLLTCEQINAEASEVLYGTNIFHFSDRGYLSAFQGCINASGCRGSDHLQTSSVMGMYLFLRLIGRANRMRLRFIEVELTRPQSCYYPHEINEEMEFFTSSDMPVGGHYLGKALDLLSRAHKLSVLRIKLNDALWSPEWYGPRLTMWMHFFREPTESLVIRHLQNITGLSLFRCNPEEAYRAMVERKENLQEGGRREDHIQQLKMTLEKEFIIALEFYSTLEIKMMGRSSFKYRDKLLCLAEELDIVQSEKRGMWTDLMDGIESAEKIAMDIIHTVEKETRDKTIELRQKARTKRTELDERVGKIAREMRKLLTNDAPPDERRTSN